MNFEKHKNVMNVIKNINAIHFNNWCLELQIKGTSRVCELYVIKGREVD